MAINQRNFLTVVAPFECSWHDDLRFREGGRGCVAFDAFAQNDVTVVFRERVGSQHYHYKRDDSPHYTVIIGSHRNRRLKIEVDGETAVDAAGVDLPCSASTFQSYWICVYDGLISIGKGRNPFHDLCFQWHHSNPNCSVQYVGLSSWDKHVGYRNVHILPPVTLNNSISLWGHVDHHHLGNDGCAIGNSKNELVGGTGGDFEASWGGLENYLESWELSDVIFIVGKDEGRAVPAHKVILAAAGNFGFTCTGKDIINLHDVSYPVLHAFLQYIYTGHTQMFTNGMKESFSSTLNLRDVNPESFRAMLEFLYTGKLKKEITGDINTLLLQLLLLADKFGVYLLHQECCKVVLDHLKEDWSYSFDGGHGLPCSSSDSISSLM
ncbi:unnamed protein product [Cuscuta europaea]|uniref:BTB domain-containing protein n=1 Tax=Cuscuta europaea TaxID=41803 RepID=A0A9P1E8M7_CUSEU|nr:unnamed protein product [Cuscuta europaea]